MHTTPTTTSQTQYSPEERIIMARFRARIHGAARRGVETISHGTFAVL